MELYSVFSVFFICIIIIKIASDVFFNGRLNRDKLTDMFIQGLTILGLLLLFIAGIMPFVVKNYYDSRIKEYENLSNLGAVGDFIGGTTVAFLTAASVVLLLATIIMQRKEIKISQQGIVELVKQTAASVKQAEEARKETQITNDTMKKQQFETTFFNMINLHHKILSEIRIEDITGREAVKNLYNKLIDRYNSEIYISYSEELKRNALLDDRNILDDLIKQWFMDYNLSSFIYKFEEHFNPYYDEDDEPHMTEYKDFYHSLDVGNNEEWNRREKELIKYYEQNIYGNLSEYKSILERLDFKRSVGKISNIYIHNFNVNFNNYPLKKLKILAYEDIYKEKENVIGHYYRNLYRIVKLIQEETFDMDKEIDRIEKQKYRGILRAQLSSFELLMIFYNVVYSKKGEKFKEILINTNFFDDHLITEDFIWKNDIEELASLDSPQI